MNIYFRPNDYQVMAGYQPSITVPTQQPNVNSGVLEVDNLDNIKNVIQSSGVSHVQETNAAQRHEEGKSSVYLGTERALGLFNQRPQFRAVSEYNNYNACNEYKAVSSSSFQRTGNPEADLQNYAQMKGISVEQAKSELEAMFGKPERRSNSSQGLSFIA